MPSKRSADAPAGSSKRSRTSAITQGEGALAPKPASKRWSAVSVSRNIAFSFAENADYDAYKCLCQARVDGKSADGGEDEDEDDDDEDDEEDEEDVNDRPKAKCDMGKTCMCNKPAEEYPGYHLTISKAGHNKFIDQIVHTNVRTPDSFGMYVYNDFAGYGVWEVLQNLAVDFTEAKDNWKEQWAVCQALPFYWMSGAFMPFLMIDADSVKSTFRLLGQMFLTMLATFESRNLLKPDSEVKNVGMVMALYLSLADELREYFESDDDGQPDFSRFDHYILAYAKKYNMELQGPSKTDELVEAIEDEDDEVKLPAPSADPWNWDKAYKTYAKEYGAISMIQKKGMGGDSFDITSWTSARRKQYSFSKKDPLGKEEMNAIKQGMVMQIA